MHGEYGDVPIGAITIGASTGGSNWLHGDIAEVLLYDRAFLSEGEQRLVLNYLRAKWNAQINESGWTRSGNLGPTPRHDRQDLPLSDQTNQGKWILDRQMSDDFHVYGFDWNKDELIWYVDGGVVRRAKNTNWFFPMQVMFDSEAMWSWFGKVNDADLPSTFSIDYLRVWTRANNP